MIYRVFFIFYLLSYSALADVISPTDLLNSELKKNYSFTERSLNQSDLKIESSSGNIFFDANGITVNVLSPFEEIYRIEDNFLEIHDVFLDQKQIVGTIWAPARASFFCDWPRIPTAVGTGQF